MKRRVCLLIVLLVSCCAFALTVDYDFDITGKTNAAALRDKISMPEGEEFETLEQALSAAEAYKQKMTNIRLFTSNNYSYKFDEKNNALRVTYHIVDSKTLLVLPYPKYDSNSGLTVKIKGVEKNFAGIFGEFDAALEYHKSETVNTGAFIVNGSGIKLGHGTYSGHLDTNVNFSSLRSSYTNLSLSSVYDFSKFTITPSIAVNNLHFDTLAGASLDLGVGISKISFKGFAITGSESVKLVPGIGLYQVVTGVTAAKGKVTAADTLTYYPKKSLNALANSLAFGYSLNSSIGLGAGLGTYLSFADKNSNYVSAYGSASYSKVMNGVTHSFAVSDTETIYPEAKKNGNYATASVSVGSGVLNYVQKDFRYGFEYSVSADTRYIINGNLGSYNYSRVRGQMVWFPFNNAVFNPSFRVITSVSSVPFNSFSTIPGFGVNYGDTTVILSQCMRGIRDNNSASYKITSSKAFMLINMNLTFKFISIGNFADTYATGFCDVAVMAESVKKLTQTEVNSLVTIGGEGICVLRQFPSYPIRASLGVNLDSLCNWHDLRDGLPEYELYFGLYHFF